MASPPEARTVLPAVARIVLRRARRAARTGRRRRRRRGAPAAPRPRAASPSSTSSISRSSSTRSASTSSRRAAFEASRGKSSSATRMRASGERSSCDTLARSSFCPRTSVSMRSAISLNARVSWSSSSSGRWRWRRRKRPRGGVTRAVRSPSPKRRTTASAAPTGAEMRRASGPDATPARSMMTPMSRAGRHKLGMRKPR